MNNSHHFDVIVIGGGHAGIEAAHAAAIMGSKTALISLSIDRIGLMPCNPSVGGVGKGHLVFEVSALGGLMPQLCSKTYLQVRMLNTSKGPAVQGLRLQIDKYAYNKAAVAALKEVNNLTLIEGAVEDVLFVENNRVAGVKLADGAEYYARTVVITTGTFLNGLVHVGLKNHAAGRMNEPAVTGISRFLRDAGLRLGRLKTGTPPRLLRESIDFEKLEAQDSHDLSYLYEFYPHAVVNTHICYIARTNERTHKIILDNRDKSPILMKTLEGTGPRYCPSIEDKITRFADKNSHHIFVEPEGADCDEVYPSGISTAMPLEVQECYIRSIEGFENAIITKAGYAVEYDFVYPDQLLHSLEVKKIEGLFLAGQINGTTGYEEAAAQGIIAGINAHQKVFNKEPFVPGRHESYIGVMIDDLVSFGVDEPYRMFTSRAERRIVLRQDNAFTRLTPYAYALGLVTEQFYQDVCAERNAVEQALNVLRTSKHHARIINSFDALYGQHNALREFILQECGQLELVLSDRAVQTIYAEIKYTDYLVREQREVEKAHKYRELRIPEHFEYTNIPGLSKELQEKLIKYRPATVAQAALISGMTPAAVSLLIFKVREQGRA
jgi:tRNA uridine 5-carboxymethylaminomethyl modification enzyme